MQRPTTQFFLDADLSDSESSSVSDHEELVVEERENVDYYGLLNVKPDAPVQDIRKSYRTLSTTFHPDRQDSAEEKALSAKTFNEMSHAKTVLTNKFLRLVYDKYGEEDGVRFVKNNTNADLRSFQVGFKYRNPASLDRIIKYARHYQDSDELTQAIAAIGDLELKLDGRGVFEEILSQEFPDYPTVSSYQVTHMMQLQTGNQDVLLPYGKVYVQFTPESSNVYSHAGFQFKRRISRWMSLLVNGEVGIQDLGIEFLVNRKIFTGQNIEIGMHVDLTDGECDFQCKTTRNLFGMGHGSLNLKMGGDESISWDLDLGYKDWDFSSTVDFGRVNGVHFKAERQMSENQIFWVQTKLDLTNILSLEYALSQPLLKKKETTIEFSVSASLAHGLLAKVKVQRNTVSLKLPILLTDDIDSTAFLAGFILPVTFHYLCKKVKDLWCRSKENEDLQTLNESGKSLFKKRQDALKEQDNLYRDAMRRKKMEARAEGLVITKAYYGSRLLERFDSETGEMPDMDKDLSEDIVLPSYFDCTIAVQYAVRESKLYYSPQNFSELPGFYDPSPGQTKFLLVIYTCDGQKYKGEIMDDGQTEINLPNENDLLSEV